MEHNGDVAPKSYVVEPKTLHYSVHVLHSNIPNEYSPIICLHICEIIFTKNPVVKSVGLNLSVF